MTPAPAFNTAISFTTNTSWQNYPGESTLGHVGLAAGLGVQAFASAAVGMCVAVALIRGLAQYQLLELGNFWVDLTRTVVRILIPLSIIIALILLGLRVINHDHPAHRRCHDDHGRARIPAVAGTRSHRRRSEIARDENARNVLATTIPAVRWRRRHPRIGRDAVS